MERQTGERIRARRTELGLNQDQIPGVSSAWLRGIEKGLNDNPNPSKLHALEAGLGWAPGSIHRIDDGLDPLETTAVPSDEYTLANMTAACEGLADMLAAMTTNISRTLDATEDNPTRLRQAAALVLADLLDRVVEFGEEIGRLAEKFGEPDNV